MEFARSTSAWSLHPRRIAWPLALLVAAAAAPAQDTPPPVLIPVVVAPQVVRFQFLPMGQFAVGQQDPVGQARLLEAWAHRPVGPASHVWARLDGQPETIWLRRRVTIGAGVTKAHFVVTCDDLCEVFVDGGRVADVQCGHGDLTVVDLLDLLPAGDHVIAVRAVNTGGPAALAAWLLWDDAKGGGEIVTDGAWHVALAEAAGWAGLAFDDSRWDQVAVGGSLGFGRNLYGGQPGVVHFEGAVRRVLSPVAAAADACMRETDAAAAMRALEHLERAMADARQRLWAIAERQASAGAPTAPRDR